MPRKSGKPPPPQGSLHFDALVEAVRQVHEHSAAMASVDGECEPDAAQLGDRMLHPGV